METVDQGGRRERLARLFALVLATSCAALSAAGCRVTDDDVHRWEGTVRGPEKLQAVLLHDKYDTSLRVEAALSLVRMKPRQGRRVGIGMMISTFSQVPPEPRQMIAASLVPALIAELKHPPPVYPAVLPEGQRPPQDETLPYKDAAYALLTGDRLITDEALQQSIKTALIEWALVDFDHRLLNRSQTYGMEQMLRTFGAPGVVGLPKLMTRDAQVLDQMSALVAELGDAATKTEASNALVAIVKAGESEEWLKIMRPKLAAKYVEDPEKKLTSEQYYELLLQKGLTPEQFNELLLQKKVTPEQFNEQLLQWQDEYVVSLFSLMRKVGQRPAIDHLFTFAASKEQREKRRQASLAALEGNIEKNNAAEASKLLAIAASDAPDAVLDQAFRRIGSMSREVDIEKLYDVFKTDKWKVRRAAAATALRMSSVKNIDEFMAKLPKAKGFAMPEALSYGGLFGDLKEGKPAEAIAKYLKEGSATARTSAISYYFTYGTKADLGVLASIRDDKEDAPSCDADPDCKWICDVPKEGAKDPSERDSKEIKTIGDFVRFCVEPAMKDRQVEAPKDEKK